MIDDIAFIITTCGARILLEANVIDFLTAACIFHYSVFYLLKQLSTVLWNLWSKLEYRTAGEKFHAPTELLIELRPMIAIYRN